MRVLEIIHGLTIGGAEIDLLGKLTKLAAQPDWQITVCCLMRRGPLAPQAERAGLSLIGPLMRGRYDVTGGLGLRRLLLSQPWDVVHSHIFAANWVTAAVYQTLPRRQRPPLLCSEHALAERWGNLALWLYQNLIQKTARQILFPSQAGLAGFVRRGLAPEKLGVFYNGIDLQRFASVERAPARQAWREKLGIAAGDIVIGSVGRLERVKGIHHLLDAFSILAAAEAGVHLIIAGSGSQSQNLQAQAGRLNLAGRVHWIGQFTDVPALLAALDILVMPSLSESFGLAAAEALLMGVPVAASHVGGIPEAVGGEAGAYLLPAGNPAALAQTLGEMIHHLPAAQKRARTGQQHVQAHFDLDMLAAQLASIYQNLP